MAELCALCKLYTEVKPGFRCENCRELLKPWKSIDEMILAVFPRLENMP